MMLRVRERGDEVHIEVDGVAGRQQHVLQALSDCQRRACEPRQWPAAVTDVNVRAGANSMRIRLKSRDGLRCEASWIYRCLREALVERSVPASAGPTAS